MQFPRFTAVSLGLVRTFYFGRSQLWSLGTLRKDRLCCLCGSNMRKGDAAYIPITHQSNRMYRAHERCVDRRKSKPKESRDD